MTITEGAQQRSSTARSGFHEASWEEPLLNALSSPGQRGVIVPAFEERSAALPESLRRRAPLELPEVCQPQVLRHYSRLSQMTLGGNVAIDLTWGTATRKYNPVVNERIVDQPSVLDAHPRQDDETVQGTLRLLWELTECLKILSGMDAVALQPGGGAQGILANALIIRRYHERRGDHQRDEIISTLLSHPSNPAAAAAAGFRVIELPPGPMGYPSVDALREVLSDRTAGLLISNPEDTGIFNPEIAAIVDLVHQAGGLCAYDQANANGTIGIARARDAGFDLCQFNLHKTFASPMSLFGSAVGAVGATAELAELLPTPLIVRDGERYRRDYDRPHSIGTVRAFLGNCHAALKAYAWTRALGLEGLRLAARTAVLNNNYLCARLCEIDGVSIAYPQNHSPRLEQIRYSWEQLTEQTGVGSEEIMGRITDYGLPAYWTSHEPQLVPQPFSLEPTESFSKAELDEAADVLARVADEARHDPDIIRQAPHRAPGRIRWDLLDEHGLPVTTWHHLP